MSKLDIEKKTENYNNILNEIPSINNIKKPYTKRTNSELKNINPNIFTQLNPNQNQMNILQKEINPHNLAFTPTNKSQNIINQELLLSPKSIKFINKKTLILDIDETLVHSSLIPFKKNDIELEISLEGVPYTVYVLVRPGVEKFLKEIGKHFEVITFTASIPEYAKKLIEILDKEKIIKHQLFREHCTRINGTYIKELKKLNRNMQDVIIVDNSPVAFAFDINNGLPIKSWYNDIDDNELEKILPILLFLAKTKDVRKYIKKFVKFGRINYDEANKIINNHKKIKEKQKSLSPLGLSTTNFLEDFIKGNTKMSSFNNPDDNINNKDSNKVEKNVIQNINIIRNINIINSDLVINKNPKKKYKLAPTLKLNNNNLNVMRFNVEKEKDKFFNEILPLNSSNRNKNSNQINANQKEKISKLSSDFSGNNNENTIKIKSPISLNKISDNFKVNNIQKMKFKIKNSSKLCEKRKDYSPLNKLKTLSECLNNKKNIIIPNKINLCKKIKIESSSLMNRSKSTANFYLPYFSDSTNILLNSKK